MRATNTRQNRPLTVIVAPTLHQIPTNFNNMNVICDPWFLHPRVLVGETTNLQPYLIAHLVCLSLAKSLVMFWTLKCLGLSWRNHIFFFNLTTQMESKIQNFQLLFVYQFRIVLYVDLSQMFNSRDTFLPLKVNF